MKFFAIGAVILMVAGVPSLAVGGTADNVDAMLKTLAAEINARQAAKAQGSSTTAIAGKLSMTLNVVASADQPLESDAQGQLEARNVVCNSQGFRSIIDRYGVTFHLSYTAPNWLMPIKATVVPSDCSTAASISPQPAPPAAHMPTPAAKHPATTSSTSQIGSAQDAAPSRGLVYLTCTTSQGSSTMDWEITLNEAEGTVDYDTGGGGSGQQRRAARFTQDKVFFIGVELSRVDLSFRRQLSDTEWQTGQCHLAERKRRAF